MNELDVKHAVRQRDGFRCRDCGMTDEESVSNFGRGLHVHRLIPGSSYLDGYNCVTLCQTCHGPKPKDLKQLIFNEPERTGIAIFWYNLYQITDRTIYDLLCEEAKQKGLSTVQLMDAILLAHFAERFNDYVI